MVYQIIINLNNEEYIFKPHKKYIITDPDIPVDQHVIMYHLEYTNITGETIIAEIPYYISNGHTNQLKAFLLFPFMCFSPGVECPTIPGSTTKGVLLKYQVCNNMNLEILEEVLDNNFIERYNEDQTLSNHKLQLIKEETKGGSIGITSILPRMTNVLDYIIALCSDWIINIRPDMLSYRPSGDPHYSHNPVNALNPECIDDQSSRNKYDIYRWQLIHILHSEITNLLQFNYFQIKSIDILLEEKKTHKEFNEIIGLYLQKEKNIKNVENYVIISTNLHLNLIKETDKRIKKREESAPKKSRQEEGDTEEEEASALDVPIVDKLTDSEFAQLFQELLKISTEIYGDGTPRHALQDAIEVWSKVKDPDFNKKYKKDYLRLYLKYKSKYINLKNNIKI